MTAAMFPFAVAPMMGWTDRHGRYFHRLLTRRALLFTEMVVADAVVHGDRARLLVRDGTTGPLAVQLGGSDPARLAEAAAIVEAHGFDAVNLNVGCPSDRVQSGTFGACLMRTPELVGDCVAAMKAATRLPVTVKCRIGVDDQDAEEALDRLADAVVAVGADAIWVHARKAWLAGLSPRENREVPPLDYDRVYRLKQRLAGVPVGLNGGLTDLVTATAQLDRVDGVMLGRAACERPAILAAVDRRFFGAAEDIDPVAAALEMIPYVEARLAEGVRLATVVRPMIGLFHGRPGARDWRRRLSVDASRGGAGVEVLRAALAAVAPSDHHQLASPAFAAA